MVVTLDWLKKIKDTQPNALGSLLPRWNSEKDHVCKVISSVIEVHGRISSVVSKDVYGLLLLTTVHILGLWRLIFQAPRNIEVITKN